ncbi:MAG: helix-turn-helix domain-containing protein [Armatimonadota bacterium]|nr:helix-turn-helix domain-containing protein [Armatimonadota bacterium]
MVHAPRYSFQGQARLAADAGVSRSTISRLISGRINPSYRLAQAVTDALEKHLKRPLDLRELLSPDGAYPTASGCALAGCRGCMPEEAYDAEGNLKPEYRDQRPGHWSLARPSHPQQPLSNHSNHGHSNHHGHSKHGKESR